MFDTFVDLPGFGQNEFEVDDIYHDHTNVSASKTPNENGNEGAGYFGFESNELKNLSFKDQMIADVLKYSNNGFNQEVVSTSSNTNTDNIAPNVDINISTIDVTGLDPVFNCVDMYFSNLFDMDITKAKSSKDTTLSISCVHSHTPLQASVCGTQVVHGLHGEQLSHRGFYDLSHMGIGLRHTGGLIKLPLLLTDLYKEVFCNRICLVLCKIFIE